MAKRSKKIRKPQAKLQDFVAVTFADDLEQAKAYESLLKINNIPTVINEQHQSRQVGTQGIAVMVPEDFLDEAHVIIESQDAYDDFYDFAWENEDDIDFESDSFDDDF